jgi:hypothetical protein
MSERDPSLQPDVDNESREPAPDEGQEEPSDKPKQAQAANVIESPMARRAREEAKRLADRYIMPDGSQPTPEILESAIADAAKLDKTAYELERRELAERFGTRAPASGGASAETEMPRSLPRAAA